MDEESYSGKNITIHEGLDHVRKRPSMYIGDTGSDGLHHLIWEILDNSIDEASSGYGSEINVTLHKDNSISVEDQGRGMPIDIHPEKGIPTATVIMTILGAGGKFDSNVYSSSGGLHGVGASVVNALSSSLTITIKRNKTTYQQTFSKGVPTSELIDLEKKSTKTGTKITFFPDPEIFKEVIEFDEKIIIDRLKNTSFLNKNLRINFSNEINGNKLSLFSENGLVDFINDVAQDKLFQPVYFSGTFEDTFVEVAFTYESSYSKKSFSFANNIGTKEGGTHETGFITAFTKVILDKIKDNKFNSEDVKEGLTSIVSVKVKTLDIKGQTKEKLNNPEARTSAYKITKDFVEKWVEENPKIFKIIFEKIKLAAKARDSAKRTRENLTKESTSIGVLPGKLTDCQTKDRSIAELFIVEGESAAGSAKQSRNKIFQAILPLKGKILNVEKHQEAMESDEVKNIAVAIGTGIGKDYDYSKLRYNKLIIMTDADVDGGHIQFLLLMFLHKYYPELIKKGHVYIACPPLFRAKKNNGKDIVYLKDEKAKLKKFPTKESEEGWTIGRFKGLGEMNASELGETTMDEKTRSLIQIKYDDNFLKIDEVFKLLGSKEGVDFRKWFLMLFTNRASLDI